MQSPPPPLPAAPPSPPRPPLPLSSFSWKTLPIFAETSNVTGPFDDDALHILSKFQLFVTEKAYNYPSKEAAEDKLESVIVELKSRAASAGRNITAIFYYNTNLDLPDYHLHSFTSANEPHWWMQDDNGMPVWAHQDTGEGARPPFPYTQLRIFNHSVPALRDLWVSECVNMTRRGFDGCFVDRWTRNPKVKGVSKKRMQKWSSDRDLATAALNAQSKELGFWLVGEGDSTSAIANPGWGNSLNINGMLAAAANGQGYLAARDTRSTANVQNELAAFLVAASTNHFFGAGRWTVNHTSRAGIEWLPEYDRPLGEPLGPATLKGHVYSRSFASGTTVTFDTKAKSGQVHWADSSRLFI